MRALNGVITPTSALPPISNSTESSSAAMEEKAADKGGIESSGILSSHVARRRATRECGRRPLNKREGAPKNGISPPRLCLYLVKRPLSVQKAALWKRVEA